MGARKPPFVSLCARKSDKPGSVEKDLHPFSPSFISACNCLQAPSAYPPAAGEQPLIAGILGLSTREVYPCLQLPPSIVVSYTTFSPLPNTEVKAVLFCGTRCLMGAEVVCPSTRLLAGTALFVARTFLHHFTDGDEADLRPCKAKAALGHHLCIF